MFRRLGFVVALLIAPSSTFAADEVDRCIAASERGQDLQRNKSFSEARAAYAECSNVRCPALIRQTCTDWLTEVDQAIPSIVVSVARADGKAVADAKVTLDGRPIALGTAIQVDPGQHQLVARAPEREDASMPFTAREGEKNRALRVTLAATTKKVADTQEPAPDGGGIRPVTWITGGLALAALGGFAYFGLNGLALRNDYEEACGTRCSDENRSDVKTQYLLADISLVAAIVLGGVSIYTLLSKPTETSAAVR